MSAGTPAHEPTAPDRAGILVHFMERELLRMAGVHGVDGPRLDNFDQLTRLAILFSPDRAVMPAPSYFETEYGYEILRRFGPCLERGQFGLLGTGANPDAYLAHKSSHWANDLKSVPAYADENDPRRNVPCDAWNVKHEATDDLIAKQWRAAVEDGSHPWSSTWLDAGHGATKNQDLVYNIPEAVEGTALLVDNITAHLPRRFAERLEPRDGENLRVFLAAGFFGSYLGDRWGPLLDVPIGCDVRALAPDGVSVLSVRKLLAAMAPLGITDELLCTCSVAQIAELADTAEWRTLAGEILRRTPPFPEWTAPDLLAVRRVHKRRLRLPVHGRKRVERLKAYFADLANELAIDRRPGGRRGVQHQLRELRGTRIGHVERIDTVNNYEARQIPETESTAEDGD